MAQAALTGGELSLIRGDQWIDGASLHVVPLIEIVSGTLGAVSTKYPTTQLTVTWGGATTDVVIGNYYRIYDGTDIVSHGIIRKAVNGTICYINETPLGSFGFATNIESAIAAGMTIRIYSHHAMFSLNSRISGKTFFKYWDLAYTTQNESQLPIANAGAWQCAKLGAGETTVRFTLPRNGVNISSALADSTVFSYEWFLPSGVTLVSGYAVDDEIIEVDAEAGTHQVALEIFNDGYYHRAYVWLFVSDGITTLGLEERFAIDAPKDDRDTPLGREMSFTMYGENLGDYLYNGAGFLFKENAKYAGESLDASTGIDSFIGYITELNIEHDGNIGKASFKVVAPMILAQQIGQPSQSLTMVVNAANWNEVRAPYSNIRAFIHYLIKWTCPTLLDLHDLDIPIEYEQTTRKYLEVNGKNLGANVQTAADYLLTNIGSASDGSTVVRLKPQYLSNADRNTVPLIWTILDQDIKAPLTYIKRTWNPVSDVRVGGFIFSSTPTAKPKAALAARRWSQGSGTAEMPSVIVTPSEGETRLREIAGHFMAEQNAAIQGISVDLIRNQDVIDPAYMTWYALTISSSFDPMGVGFSATRMVATEITREWEIDGGGLKKRIKLTGQIETFGQAGEILPIGNAQGISQGGWSIGTPEIWTPNTSSGMFGGAQAASFVLLLNEVGAAAISYDYLNAEPNWASINFGVGGGQISDFCFDYGSDFFAQGRNAAAALGLYAVTVVADTATIWYYPNIMYSNAATRLTSYTLADSTATLEGRIVCSETYPLLVLAVFKDGTGTRYGRSTDGGTTWAALARAGDSITDIEDNEFAPIGVVVSGQYQFLTAPNSSGEYGTYRATTAAGSFSKMTGSQDSLYPMPMIAEAIEQNDYLFVSQAAFDPYSNDFDASNDFPYDNTIPYALPSYREGISVVWAYDGIVGGGVSGNCVQFTGTNPDGEGGGVDRDQLIFEMPSTMTIYNITGYVWFTTPSGQQLALDAYNLGGSTSTYFTVQSTWTSFNLRELLPDNFPAIDIDFTGVAFSPRTNVIGSMVVKLDNITIYAGDGDKLWRVSDATGSPTWQDITPTAGKAPMQPFALNVNIMDGDKLQIVTREGNTWYKSVSSGSGWSLADASSDFRTFYTQGNNWLGAGLDTVQISFNGGLTDTSIEGNLDNLFDSIGTIKKIIAL